jgi:rhodanese-related sulfurtransferase
MSHMNTINQILATARERAMAAGREYEGEVLPREALTLLTSHPDTVLIDVRTEAEWEWVGRVPDSVLVQWNTWPGGQANPHFMTQLQKAVPDQSASILFLCRSGARSHNAATAATRAGYAHCFNILTGFEGDKNPAGQRNRLGGWRFEGLPWIQG